MYGSPHPSQPAAAPPAYTRPAANRYPMLRFVAATCVFSGWATLALSVIVGLMIMAAPTPPLPIPGASAGGAPGAGDVIAPLLGGLMAGMKISGGLMTIATGIGACLIQLALGLVVYVFIDIEENTRLGAQAMTAIARRMGMG
jgi:hypothetical protein